MVRRLVEDQAVDAARLEQREHRAASLPRRERARRPQRVLAADAELRQERPRVGRCQARRSREAVEQRLVRSKQLAALVELAEDDARADVARRRVRAASLPSSARSSVVLPAPFRPMIATRSPQPTSRSIGPSRNAPRSTTAPARRATTSPLRERGASSAAAATAATASRPLRAARAVAWPARPSSGAPASRGGRARRRGAPAPGRPAEERRRTVALARRYSAYARSCRLERDGALRSTTSRSSRRTRARCASRASKATIRVTVRSRNARSWETRTIEPS